MAVRSARLIISAIMAASPRFDVEQPDPSTAPTAISAMSQRMSTSGVLPLIPRVTGPVVAWVSVRTAPPNM